MRHNARRTRPHRDARSAALLAVLFTVSAAAPAVADGGFMPPYGLDIYEPGQTAFIRYDSATATETLSILPKFLGEPTDFAWIVPVPALPTVVEANADLFRQLSTLTQPLYRSRESNRGCEDRYDYVVGDPMSDDGGVEIIDNALIGIYRTMILGSADAGALVDSLTTWGFLHAGNLATVTPLLQQYVDDGWYFVTMSIDSTAVAGAGWPYGKKAANKEAANKDAPWYHYPSLQPVSITFASADIVYPLRISRISAYEDNAVHLYVAADHRVEFPSGQTAYANRLTDAEFEVISRMYPQLRDELWSGAFLTKLHRSYTPAEMDHDLVLTRASNDTEFLPIRYSGLPVGVLVMGGSVAWWLAFRRRFRRRP